MNKIVGIVKEVFIPQENNIDIMDSIKIGFKINVDNKIIEIIQEQDENNANIYKNDKVLIIKELIDNKEFIDIEKLEDKDYE